jgi:hypothetical protein
MIIIIEIYGGVSKLPLDPGTLKLHLIIENQRIRI